MRVLFIVLLLAGCGGGGEPAQSVQTPAVQTGDNHGYGFQYDVQGASGLRLRGSADLAQLERLYAETEVCTGLNAPAPFVIIVPPKSLDVSESPGITLGVGGQYLNHPSLILLDPSRHGSMEHESIHYLLDVNTGDADPNHKSPFFVDCAHTL